MLNSGLRRAVFLLAVVTGAVWLGARTLLWGIAEQMAETGDIHQVSWAARIDPQNAAIQNQLGLLYEWEGNDISASVEHLRRATELNPHIAGFWADLGTACELADQSGCIEDAYRRAVALAPRRADLRWNLANYYVRSGKDDQVLAEFVEYLRLDANAPSRTFDVLNKRFDPSTVWQKVISELKNPEIALMYLTDLKARQPQAATSSYWRQIISGEQSFRVQLAIPYIDRLLENKEYAAAQQAWSDLKNAGLLKNGKETNNLIFNGNFDQTPLNGGLDWQWKEQPYLETDFETSGMCSSSQCLHLNFAVPQNAESEPVYQIVPVQPNQTYVMTAIVRSQDLTSDSGPRLRVQDADCSTCLMAATESITGTTPWHKLELDFSTGAQARAIKVSVWRPRSRTYPMEISGEFWLDSVSLRESVSPEFQ